jgi:hypothetical protein
MMQAKMAVGYFDVGCSIAGCDISSLQDSAPVHVEEKHHESL